MSKGNAERTFCPPLKLIEPMPAIALSRRGMLQFQTVIFHTIAAESVYLCIRLSRPINLTVHALQVTMNLMDSVRGEAKGN